MEWEPTDDLYVLAAIADSASNDPNHPWKTIGEGSTYQMIEVGLTVDIPQLGRGTYRFIPWHNHVDGASGFGLGFNCEQELGTETVVGFVRLGVADDDVAPASAFISGGFALYEPFGRGDDRVSLGVSWVDPAPLFGDRPETLIEVQYRLALATGLELTPDVQIVLDPGIDPDTQVTWIVGLRLALRF